MKKIISIAFISTAVLACEAPESIQETLCSDYAQLYGDWDVSLNYDPSQAPSKTNMSISGDGTTEIDGSFYGSPFEAAAMNGSGGYYIFMAQTSDNSGPYFHSGRYDCASDKIIGQTWSHGREFLMPWTAERARGE